jgi:hypothetical protein
MSLLGIKKSRLERRVWSIKADVGQAFSGHPSLLMLVWSEEVCNEALLGVKMRRIIMPGFGNVIIEE